LAQTFQSQVWLLRENHRVEAKNIMDLLTLGAAQGTQLVLEADGDDAQQAVDALAKLVAEGFASDEVNNGGQQGDRNA
jgi:phosphocarrier protein